VTVLVRDCEWRDEIPEGPVMLLNVSFYFWRDLPTLCFDSFTTYLAESDALLDLKKWLIQHPNVIFRTCVPQSVEEIGEL